MPRVDKIMLGVIEFALMPTVGLAMGNEALILGIERDEGHE